MTGPELVEARAELGMAWGLGRPLFASELGRILGMGGRDPGESIRDWETGRRRMPGPAEVAVELMLAGALPQALQGLVEVD
jgi:hypothetical protein